MLAVVGTCVGYVVHHFVAVELEPLADVAETFGTEGSLGVNVERLSRSAAFAHRELTDHRERVTELRFTGSELAVELGDGS